MPSTILTFPSLNFSAQVGDTVYYTQNDNAGNTMSESGGFQYAGQTSYASTNLGDIISITTGVGADGVAVAGGTHVNIEVFMDNPGVNLPTSANYVFIVKDNKVNTAGLIGYYGELKLVNETIVKAELFSVACEVSESSK